MSLTKREIAKKVAEKIGATQTDAAAAVQATFDIMVEELKNCGHIELRGFGVFEIKTRKACIGRNPKKPDDVVQIPARKIVKFRAGKELAAVLENA
ncbi:MAG: integration host factor subunit beta [Lentisphaeria bacterium]|nr:integration host factor subunit beta [Lentisphaeria bacterium]